MAASTAVSIEDTPSSSPTSERAIQFAALTGFRGLAALMVVLVHVSFRTEYTWLGVTHFGPVTLFVLSGFLLYRPWAQWMMRLKDRPNVRVFARRRLARIFPPYLVVLVIVALVYPAARPDGAAGWLYSITLTWIYKTGYFPVVMAQTWSLATELSWYVALPVMAGVTGAIARRCSPRTGFWVAAGLMALSLPITLCWRLWVEQENLTLYFTYIFWLPAYLVCFAAGALIAHISEGIDNGIVNLPRFRRLVSDPWALLVVALATALLATSALGKPEAFNSRPFLNEQALFWLVALLSTILLAVIVFTGSASVFTLLLGTRGFVAVGRWSYGIYLWHLPLVIILEDHVDYPQGLMGLLARFALIFPISIALGAATHAWVERPAIAWSHQVAARTSSDQVQPRLREENSARTEPTSPSSSTAPQQPAPTSSQNRSDSPGG